MEEKRDEGLLSEGESTHNNEQLARATEETVQRIQGVSEGTTTPDEVISKAAANINAAADTNKDSLQELANEYKRLSEVISTVLNGIAGHLTPLLNNLESQKNEPDYQDLVEKYATYEEKKQKIREEYAAKIKVAENNKNEGLKAQLEKTQEKDIQKLSAEELINSDDYVKLFTQLDNLTLSEMTKLRNNLESEWLNMDLQPEEFEKLKKKIDEASKVINDKNPFIALSNALKAYLAGERKFRPKELAKEAGAAFNTLKGSLDEVSNLMPSKTPNQKINKELVGDISKMVGSAGDVAAGIASGNFSQVLQGGIKLVSSAVKVFSINARNADRDIAKHAEKVKNLEKSYAELERAMNKALGFSRYTASKNALENLKQQEKSIEAQRDLERGKKRSDKDKINEYNDSLLSVKNKQIDLINNIRKDLLGTDAKSAAQELGNAFIEAFGKGAGAAEAFGEKVDNIVANIIKTMLIQKLLEEPVGRILDKYSKKWYDDQNNFVGFDNVMRDADKMGKELKGIGPGFAEAMENLPDDIKKYFVDPESSGDAGGSGGSGGLAGAIKGVSEDTANLVAGQMNAIRINQLEANAMMGGNHLEANGIIRDQLTHLSMISHNTSYNKYLKNIDERIARMEAKDTLRAQGLS